VLPALVRTGKTPLPTATLTVAPERFNTGKTVGKVDHDGTAETEPVPVWLRKYLFVVVLPANPVAVPLDAP